MNTNPVASDFLRGGQKIGRVDPKPGATPLKNIKHHILIKCVLSGYQKATFHNISGAAATFGNVVIGGAVGWAIDSASGFDNKHTSPVNLTLVPGKSK